MTDKELLQEDWNNVYNKIKDRVDPRMAHVRLSVKKGDSDVFALTKGVEDVDGDVVNCEVEVNDEYFNLNTRYALSVLLHEMAHCERIFEILGTDGSAFDYLNKEGHDGDWVAICKDFEEVFGDRAAPITDTLNPDDPSIWTEVFYNNEKENSNDYVDWLETNYYGENPIVVESKTPPKKRKTIKERKVKKIRKQASKIIKERKKPAWVNLQQFLSKHLEEWEYASFCSFVENNYGVHLDYNDPTDEEDFEELNTWWCDWQELM